MMLPCIVKNSLYVSALRTLWPGCASCVRMPSARRPPTQKNPKDVTR